MELILYIIIGIIWLIVSLIQKAAKGGSKKVSRPKTINKKVNTNNRKSYNNNDDEIYRNLRKSISELKNINENNDDFYDDEYEPDNEILEEQNRYASRIRELESQKSKITEESPIFNVSNQNRRHVNHMLTSLDIKNAIIYNAILEPKRINYYRKIKRETNK
ncbi:hypothetical protein [Brachyspira sp. SAP_772]|uniref:hypothetical protein n=1 Tax=Brachyspira sp. SAP_772 TaxID=2608385 RepID=UPI0012F48996|nr:hypothetical protein [Brachyspira sp. SAP_772]